MAVDQLAPQRGSTQLEERVHELEPLVFQVDDRRCVGSAQLVERQHRLAVLGAHHVAEAGRLDDVAEFEVEGEAQRECCGVEHQVVDRPAELFEVCAAVVERCPLPLVYEVVDEGVVHVVADRPHAAEVEGAVAEHAAVRLTLGEGLDHRVIVPRRRVPMPLIVRIHPNRGCSFCSYVVERVRLRNTPRSG